VTEEWYRWYTGVVGPCESLTLDYDAQRIIRLYVRALVEEAQRKQIKAAWAKYRAGGELIL
jgi:hypothetical protein